VSKGKSWHEYLYKIPAEVWLQFDFVKDKNFKARNVLVFEKIKKPGIGIWICYFHVWPI